jgi:hypothetical protein
MPLRRSLVLVLCLALLNLGSPLVAHAELIGTLQAAQSSAARAQDLATINSTLARAEVRSQMLALGVAPADVATRVARLTDPELHSLAERMNQMPAGGDGLLAVIGVVFLVLLILELVGVIDIFKKT